LGKLEDAVNRLNAAGSARKRAQVADQLIEEALSDLARLMRETRGPDYSAGAFEAFADDLLAPMGTILKEIAPCQKSSTRQ
jgi:hypothetical protein